MAKTLPLLIAIFILSAISRVSAADLDKGVVAYDEANYAEALKEFAPLAEQGNPTAQVYLGLMYKAGKGVSQDYGTAVMWLVRAADQGDVFGQLNLALMYHRGIGVTQDVNAAFKWYHLAAEQGALDAQYWVGYFYEKGAGVRRDLIYAYMWYSIASRNAKNSAKPVEDALRIMRTVLLPEQLASGEKLIQECMAKSYKGC